MIALDTNVLVRFLVEDDAEQTAKVQRLIRGALERNQSLFVSEIVLCEIVWVLRSSYRFQRAEILTALGLLLRSQQLAFASRERIFRAVDAYRAGRGDFADYMIRSQAVEFGCRLVATFERALQKEDGFIAVSSSLPP